MTDCPVTHTIDYDSLDCHLPAGHAGPHKDDGAEEGPVWWQKNDLRKQHG